MINCAILGDSIPAGSILDQAGNLHTRDCLPILHAAQSTFQFTNFAKAGASFENLLSDNALNREGAGLPDGQTLDEFVKNSGFDGFLFSFGGNDNAYANPSKFISNVKACADTCVSSGKMFAFVGILNVNASQSWTFLHNTDPNVLWAPLATHASYIAFNAELLRQTCLHYSYPLVDLRNVLPVDLTNITGDIVHPTAEYFQTIWTKVGRSLVGQ